MGVGDDAFGYANAQIGKPYITGGTGPQGFDCSGLCYAAYMHGPSPGIVFNGQNAWAQMADTTHIHLIWDIRTPNHPGPETVPLEVGDLLFFGRQSDIGTMTSHGHEQMYAGSQLQGPTVIEAPSHAVPVRLQKLTMSISSDLQIMGIGRVGGGGAASGSGSTGTGASDQSGSGLKATQDVENLATVDLPDPRDNRPFSEFFMGKVIPGPDLAGGLTGKAGYGSFEFDLNNVSGHIMPTATLVHGGMSELYAMDASGTHALPVRPRGFFKCFFMLNPESISAALDINTDVAPPTQLNAAVLQVGTYPVSNQSISFQIVFNRMYEVWKGDMPGPSDLGVRWDIRALERLMGMYDATLLTGGGNSGGGNYGAQGRPPVSMPIQVVFGGPNSIMFQGLFASMDYTYTRFDRNMIPTEATVNISVMRMYMPTAVTPDLVSALIQVNGQIGKPYVPNSKANFDAAGGAPIAPGHLISIP